MLKLIKPGKRGKYYTIRGTVHGERYEVSSRTADKNVAEKVKASLEFTILTQPGLAKVETYGEATHQYLEKRKMGDISKHEIEMHLKIVGEIGAKHLTEITQAEIDRLAAFLYPSAKPATLNRWVVIPISSVMHYAARSGHCHWIRIHKFKQPKPETRAVNKDIAKKIIAEAGKQERNADLKQLICLWMFKHGNRISEIISIKGKDIDFKQKTFKLYISKTKTWKTFPLDPQVMAALKKSYKDGMPEGIIFPWSHRHSVYKWLRPMCKGIGIHFSPHMARHSLGTWFAARGASLRTIMDRLGHEDVKSSMRYQATDIGSIRAVNQKIGDL